MLLLLALFSLLTIQPTIGQQQYVEFVQPDEPYQVPMTLPFVFQQQQQGIPSSYLRPLLVDFQNRPDFTELGNKPTEPLPNVAVTLPFVFNPPNEKPNSYLRPLLVDFDDEPVFLQEDKPIRQNQPAVEDLTSPLPALLANKKPTSYLRPLLVDFQSQPAVIEDLTLPAAANTAVTVPLLLQESEENGPSFTPIRQTNPSIPNKNVAVTLPFAFEKKPTTDADDQPAGDLTSDPISGTVQQPSAQQNAGVMTLPFFLEPIAHHQQSTVSHQQGLVKQQPTATGGAFIVRNRLPDLAAPSGVYWPLIASLLADSANQQRPLKPTTATKPWIYQPVVQTTQEDWYNPSRPSSSQQQQVSQQPTAVQQTIKQTKPWFLPVGQPVIQENGPTGYQLVRPLIAFPAYINQRKQLAGQAEARRPFFNSFLLNGTTQMGNRNVTLRNGNNKGLTQTSTVYSTEIFTVTSTIKNGYCFTSGGIVNPPSPWCTFRRKRSAEDQAQLTIDGQPIEPTQVQKILMTALPSSDNLPAITSSIEDQSMKSEGRFLIVTKTNLLTFNQPTVTSTITLLTTTTKVAITSTTPIEFAGGNCVPLCLQKLPSCAA